MALKKADLNPDVIAYHIKLTEEDSKICDILGELIQKYLKGSEHKVWHGHPVWFIEGNPIVGYHKLKDCVRMLFWSGQSFDEPLLNPEGSFKAAEMRFTDAAQISSADVKRWLKKAAEIQWDYKNIVKRKGILERLK